MRFWWVNQNQTYKSEVPGGFLWSPKTKSNGDQNRFYDNMRDVRPGDVVLSFCDTYIKALGIATGGAQSSPKPDFGKVGTSWSQDGWLVPVEFRELVSQIRPKDHIDVIKPYLPNKYAPLQQNGNGLQAVYLTELPFALAQVLGNLIGAEFEAVLKDLPREADKADLEAEKHEHSIQSRSDIGPTIKNQLIKARRGQGLFRANVRLIESACRITGVEDPAHLRASHIKPWKDSNDEEKLNGYNGLLLAPHVDHLFDRGFISFANDGRILLSPWLNRDVLEKWGIPMDLSVGAFRAEQVPFLEYHRVSILKK